MEEEQTKKNHKLYFSITGIILLILAALVARPYLNAAILALVVAYIAQPLYNSLVGKIKPRKIRASVLSTVIVLLFLLVIITILVFAAIRVFSMAINEITDLGLHTGARMDLIQEFADWINNLLVNLKLPLTVTSEQIITNFQDSISQVLKFLLNSITSIGTLSVAVVINLVIFFGLLFIFIPKFDGMLLFITNLSPLKKEVNNLLLSRGFNTAKSMVWGMLIIALADGVAAGIVLTIMGLPNALLYAVLIAVLSFIPLLGTGMIIYPIAVFLFIDGQIVKAIILAVLQIVVMSNIDTVLRAKLIPREARMPMVISFIAILGGLHMFGILGLMYGPVIFSLLLTVIDVSRTYYNPLPPPAIHKATPEVSELPADTDGRGVSA